MMHHANLLIGGATWAEMQISKYHKLNDLDVVRNVYQKMNVKDVRDLIYDTNLRPIEAEYRVFILVCDTILREAQNALLKLMEEPNEHTIFYVILPREDILLPTLKSRLHTLALMDSAVDADVFKTFSKENLANRLAIIAERLDAEDSVWVTQILKGIEQYAHETRDKTLIKEILMVQEYINTNGSSKKMLLEHLALSF